MSSAVMRAGSLTAAAAGGLSFFGFLSFLLPPGMPLGSAAGAAAAAAGAAAAAEDEGAAVSASLPGAEPGADAVLPSALLLPFSATFSCRAVQIMSASRTHELALLLPPCAFKGWPHDQMAIARAPCAGRSCTPGAAMGAGAPSSQEWAAAAAGRAASECPPWCACPSSLPCAECGRTCS